MKRIWTGLSLGILGLGVSLAGCSNDSSAGNDGSGGSSSGTTETTPFEPIATSDELPAAGTEESVEVPVGALPAETTTATTVVGTGTAESCTSQSFIEAVWNGGIITFDCGTEPVTIELEATAEVNNLGSEDVVIDGGGLVTLSGGGAQRILYQNVCLERLGWATGDCWGQGYPRLTLQNLTFINGYTEDSEGGGAVHVSGGQLKIVNCRFFHNTAPYAGPDEGGGAVRVQQIQSQPVYIVNSTFGGAGELGNAAANGGALSGLHTNFHIYNSTFVNNSTTSCCGNPATTAPGGGSGGAIYMDGVELELELHNVELTDNSCQAHGSAIFFVSNDHAGVLTITDSLFRSNAEGEGVWYPEPDISMHDDTERTITNTVFE